MFEKPGEWEDLIKQERALLSDIQDKIGRIRHIFKTNGTATRRAVYQFLCARRDACGTKGAGEMVDRIREALRPPFVQLLPFTRDAADRYARIRAELPVSAADAIHPAIAAQAGVDLFLTNNRKLLGQIIPGIQFIADLDSNLF